jgi:signal peptidase
MEDTYMVGDLVLMDKITLEEAKNLEKDQIITFRAPIDIDGDGNTGDINTHRIYGFIEETGEIITKGDNKPLPDNQSADPYTITIYDVIGVCREEPIKGLGNVISFLRSSTGFLICIVIPLILFFLYELYNFISILMMEKAKKAVASAKEISKETEEEIKRRAIEEYLRSQQAQNNSAPSETKSDDGENKE